VGGHDDPQREKTFPESAALDPGSVMHRWLHGDCDRTDIQQHRDAWVSEV